ncbi:MAG: hypothetical protein PHG35_02225 [Dehalococcoidales bacterium]|nr:hypothetical protein [Dehalococcoidales bacterium]
MLKDFYEQIMAERGAKPSAEYWVRFCQDCPREKQCIDVDTPDEVKEGIEMILCAIARLANIRGGKDMPTSPDCKFYKDGKCSHSDAPNPGHSWCIGKDHCHDYQQPDKEAQGAILQTD